MKTNNKPSVLRSCTAAAHAAAAHAQEAANWAEAANRALECANSSANRCRRLTADMQSAFSRVHAVAVAAYVFATLATVLAIIALAV